MLLLKYQGATTIPVEAECLTPDNLAGKSAAAIARLTVQHGNAEVALGDLFAVEGDAGDREIRIEGDCGAVKLIGAGMASGRITIEGNVGMHLGSEMAGGEIHVHGRVGDWAGAEMREGRIHIHGNAGNLVGAGYRGSRHGMRGGVILVEGTAGSEIGSSLRRGVIAIAGDTGDFPGVSMIAGTILLFGRPGIRLGAGMKRGTIALLGGAVPLLPTFAFDCAYRPIFMRLYLQQIMAWGFTAAGRFLSGSYKRFSGDRVALGKGEVLIWQR